MPDAFSKNYGESESLLLKRYSDILTALAKIKAAMIFYPSIIQAETSRERKLMLSGRRLVTNM
jgi:hypothetical protein